MLRSVIEMINYQIIAKDELAGFVNDFFFDDESLSIRYLVVDSRDMFPGPKVLAGPVVFSKVNWQDREFVIELSRVQLDASPSVDTQKPLSRKMEEQWHQFYNIQPYWLIGGPRGVGVFRETPKNHSKTNSSIDPPKLETHLRSIKEMIGYRVQTLTGEFGKLKDGIIDDQTWDLKYLALDIGRWMHEKMRVIPTQGVKEFDWRNRRIHVRYNNDQIIDAPAYDMTKPIPDCYKKELADYY